jgi:CHAT domain-containing protein
VGGVGPVEGAPVSAVAPASADASAANKEPSPWMSRRVWLALAGADRAREPSRTEDDGLLTAEEVVTLNLADTDWVVLSACYSAMARSWAREGSLGMRRAFAVAGARTVIASQWAVEDRATAAWMRTLYRVRAAGESGATAALQSTCRAVLAERRQAGNATHPFYWAGFVASGE